MRNAIIVILCIVNCALCINKASATTNRQERQLVSKGNELYKGGHYLEAGEKYQQALKLEPSSREALYNLGLTYIRRAGTAQSDSLRQQLIKAGADAMQNVAQSVKEKPDLAANALFNLGNIAFNSEDYAQAVQMYKSSLRVRPEDEKTRRNLRIAQKKLQQNQDDQNQDQNKDQDQQQDKQDQDQNQDQNKDRNKDQNQNQDQQQQQQQPEINPQAAEQILNAMENKENKTRARVNKANNGEKATGKNTNNKRW